jgi:GNAT superfamily N-acetyltransferase
MHVMYPKHQVDGVNDTLHPGPREPMGDPTPRVSVAGRYPVELEADILVRTGARLHLRPIRSDDATRLVTFHHNLSFDSIYRRYFSMHPELSPDEVVHLTEVDYVERMAFVVEDGEVLVAVGRYDRVPHSSTAEVAFVVRDDYQHLGLGHQLLEALADAARERGITVFTAETLLENRDMMSVFRHSKFPVTSTISDGQISVRFSITSDDQPRAARGDQSGEGR